MRILHLIHSEGVYGAELILVHLSRELLRLGHEVVVGSINDPGTGTTPFETFCETAGLRVEPIRIAPRPTPRAIRALLAARRSTGAELVHSHGYKADILLGLIPRRLRGPMVATAHGWTQPARFSALWLYQLLDRLSLRMLDRVVVVAPHMLDLAAVRGLPPGCCSVIENGIPPLEERLADLKHRAVPQPPKAVLEFVARAPTVVAIGRLSPEKGFDVLLEAFARSTARELQLAIVGAGGERAALEAQVARSGLGARVLFAGYVEGADRLLKHARGFVMSSFTEGMPLALLEAMQWGAPVVATAVGAIPHILAGGEAGSLVAPRDAAALAAALEHLASDPEPARQRAAAAVAIVERKFSSARMAGEYVRLYRTLLDAS